MSALNTELISLAKKFTKKGQDCIMGWRMQRLRRFNRLMPPLSVGDVVRVTRGPWKGKEGEVLNDDRDRQLVLVKGVNNQPAQVLQGGVSGHAEAIVEQPIPRKYVEKLLDVAKKERLKFRKLRKDPSTTVNLPRNTTLRGIALQTTFDINALADPFEPPFPPELRR